MCHIVHFLGWSLVWLWRLHSYWWPCRRHLRWFNSMSLTFICILCKHPIVRGLHAITCHHCMLCWFITKCLAWIQLDCHKLSWSLNGLQDSIVLRLEVHKLLIELRIWLSSCVFTLNLKSNWFLSRSNGLHRRLTLHADSRCRNKVLHEIWTRVALLLGKHVYFRRAFFWHWNLYVRHSCVACYVLEDRIAIKWWKFHIFLNLICFWTRLVANASYCRTSPDLSILVLFTPVSEWLLGFKAIKLFPNIDRGRCFVDVEGQFHIRIN